MDMNVFIAVVASGILALLYAWLRTAWIARQDPGNEKMVEIGHAVREGAMAFLAREYKVLAVFVVAVGILLYIGNISTGTGLVAVSFVECG
jgi:K(+)-stimulated pyrophosphate-energized sodium pump